MSHLHTFNQKTMTPTGLLAERKALIDRHFPQFFSGKRLLDIGCNKGYFSIASAGSFQEVVGIDKNKAAIKTCNMLKRFHHVENVKFVNVSFMKFRCSKAFDKVFAGHVCHHLFVEAGSHKWIDNLAKLSSGYVLMEGAYNTASPETKNFPLRFNDFMGWMSDYFVLKAMTESCVPGTHFMLWERRR